MTSTAGTFTTIATKFLRPGPGNLRDGAGGSWPDPDPDLAASIKAVGVLEPLIVRATPASGPTTWEVIAGHRRAGAAILAGLENVPVIVRQVTDAEAVQFALIENLQREDLTPLEEARAYAKLLELGSKQKDLAPKVGRSQSHVSKRLALLKLPAPAQAYLDSGRLLVEDALAMVGMEPGQVERALHDIEALRYRRLGEVGSLIEKAGAGTPARGKAAKDDPAGRGPKEEQSWELFERDLVVFRELARRRISQTAAGQRLRRLAAGRDLEWDPENLVALIGLALGDTKAPRRRTRKGGTSK